MIIAEVSVSYMPEEIEEGPLSMSGFMQFKAELKICFYKDSKVGLKMIWRGFASNIDESLRRAFQEFLDDRAEYHIYSGHIGPEELKWNNLKFEFTSPNQDWHEFWNQILEMKKGKSEGFKRAKALIER